MTMFVGVHHHCSLPAKQEVAEACAEDDSETEPDVVGHEDEHEAVGDEDLQHVKNCLYQVTGGEHSGTGDTKIMEIS